MNLNQLYYFQKVAQLQHYHQAARELNISQPSLSRSIANLEEELGVSLFQKNGRNIELTKYGSIFLEHVNRIIDEIKIAENKMKSLAGSSSGHIDIGYVFPLAKSYIPRLVRSFLNQQENHEITFSLSQEITKNLIADLKNEKYDVVFGSLVEFLGERSDVDAVLTERGANGGCGSCFACRDLQLNVTGDLLCHERHLLNIECGNDRRFRPPLARLNVSPTFAAYAAHRF